MKILQIIDLYKTGGAEKVFDLFTQYCLAKNYKTTRVVMYGEHNISDNKYLIPIESKSLFKKILDQLKCIFLLMYIIREKKIDFIVSFLDRSNLAIIFACFLYIKRPKITVTVHNPPTIQYLKLHKYIRLIYFYILSWLYNRKWIKVVAVSQNVKESLLSIGVKTIYVIYNPLVIKRNNYLLPIKNISGKFIITVGRLEEQKAHWKLIKAFYFYKTMYQDDKLRLYIFGTGALEDKLKKMCVEFKITDSVIFMGYNREVIRYINQTECMIFSSLYEGFPISLLECAGLKKPFIGSNFSIPIEIINLFKEKNIENIFKITNNEINFCIAQIHEDEKQLAYLINRIINDKNFKETISNIGYQWFCNNCSLNNFDLYL
jgi:glycosyltransferase involved in cell wall biosynthesis